ncbi:hypothetical protein DERP_003031 [Dermatophagoides pteronyssinus]|uniref:Uncharacterized protein n=1 Tax=Dermatophagoides pteronyssinus TaxID=6956 RepID=A0ABQ8JIB9_DERPT|nr:hypothetical protein DERP_003031 [Dermatophagoides pteronyssinus]
MDLLLSRYDRSIDRSQYFHNDDDDDDKKQIEKKICKLCKLHGCYDMAKIKLNLYKNKATSVDWFTVKQQKKKFQEISCELNRITD